PEDQVAEAVAWQLLRRYGVVFRRLVTRETLLVPWRDLLRVYRRLEARGEVRGGRFVGAFSGEQYALPEAVGLLRSVRRQEPGGGVNGARAAASDPPSPPARPSAPRESRSAAAPRAETSPDLGRAAGAPRRETARAARRRFSIQW